MASFALELNPNWRGGKSMHPLNDTYHDMIARCTRPTHHAYANYGGRGITVCPEWLEANPDTKKVTIDTDTGDHVPTVRVRRIEPLGPISNVSETVRAAVAAAEEERTGRKAIPFEIVEVGEHRFGDTLDES